MNDKELEDFVENFKGMLWDELDDALGVMNREELIAVIVKLKKRYGWLLLTIYFFLNNFLF